MGVLVLGATGFIGAAVVEELAGAGHEVTALARSDDAAAAHLARGLRVVRGDLRRPVRWAAVVADVDESRPFAWMVENAQVALACDRRATTRTAVPSPASSRTRAPADRSRSGGPPALAGRSCTGPTSLPPTAWSSRRASAGRTSTWLPRAASRWRASQPPSPAVSACTQTTGSGRPRTCWPNTAAGPKARCWASGCRPRGSGSNSAGHPDMATLARSWSAGSEAPTAAGGGPGGIRTPDNTVMSGAF